MYRWTFAFRKSLVFSLVIAIAACSAVPARGEVTDQQVQDAINRIKDYLYKQQDAQGGWDAGGHARNPTGYTAIVTMGLLYAGESVHHPQMKSALKYLQTNEGDGTYCIGLRAHVWGALPDKYKKNMAAEGKWLKEAEIDSTFGYLRPNNRPPQSSMKLRTFDHSATQYGILGMWQYAMRGGAVPPMFWENAIQQVLNSQNADGGWPYRNGGDSTGSMTTSGMTILLIAQQQVRRQKLMPDQKIEKAIEAGLTWLNKHYVGGSTNPIAGGGDRGHHMYYLYGIERVALANGVKMLNGKDWYESGAEAILRRLGKGGSVGSLSDTAFALSFLARGRVPVWISKLRLEGQRWNNRPNDIYFWNQFLAQDTERRMNWQVVSVDDPVDIWQTAPVLYISSDNPLSMTDEHRAKIKQYIDSGGILLCNAESGSQAFANFITTLARELYPELKFQKAVAGQDRVYDAQYKIGRSGMQNIQILSNGGRDLIYLVRNDWGAYFQKDDPPGKNDTWRLATNFYSIATARGRLDNRLETMRRMHPTTPVRGKATVALAQYKGLWNVEPSAWQQISKEVHRRSGVQVATEIVELAKLGETSAKFVHVMGVGDKVNFTEEELSAMKTFAESGGTILIETVGGKSPFTLTVAGQLQRFLQRPAVDQLPPDSPLITGEGLDGGRDISSVSFTPSLATAIRIGNSPRLRAFYFGEPGSERPAILLSNEDLTLAAMGIQQWGIKGYSRRSAGDIFNNLVLHTSGIEAAASEAGGETAINVDAE